MKKIILSLCAALGLLSCDKGGDGLQSPGEAAPLRLRSSIGELVELTRLRGGDEKYLPEGTNVAININELTAEGGEKNYVATVYTAGVNGELTTIEPVYYPLSGNKLNIYGLCINSSQSTDEINEYSIVADQSTDENYQKSDFLYTRSIGVGYTPTFVPLLFEHLNSKIVLDFNHESFADYTISNVQIVGTKTRVSYENLYSSAEPTITPIENTEAIITPFKVTVTDPDDTSVITTTHEAIIIPQSLDADAEFISFTITDSEDEFAFKNLSFELTKAMTFEKNQKHTFKFSLKDKALTATSSVSPWADGSDIEIEENLGAESKDYTLIYTVDQLKAINNSGESLRGNYLLMNDLDLKGSETNEWSPIGTSSNSFLGTFDGGGHSISGLYINISSSESSYDHIGLFGTVKNARIENLTIINPQILVEQNYTKCRVGAVVGNASTTTIKNCKVIGNANASNAYIEMNNASGFVGAIAGNIVESNIIGCHNSCTVTGHGDRNRVGGIVGSSSLSSIVACSNSGTIKETTSNSAMGGIAGYIEDSEIRGCFSVGKIEKLTNVIYAGVIVGYNVGTIDGCYYLSNEDTNNGLTGMGNGVADGTATLPVDSYEKLNAEGVIGAMNYSVYTYNDKELYDVSGKLDFGFKASDKSEDTSATAQERAPQLVEDLDYTPPKNELQAGYSPIFGVEQLSAMETSKTDVKYQLMNDLDLKGSDTNKWSPIGTSANTFSGTFDGGGHSISGLYIDHTNNSSSNNYLGLFAYAEDATIENLTIKNPQIQAGGSSYNNVGAIVGYAIDTTIKNCEVLNDEDASSSEAPIKLLNDSGYVGAIAGYTYASHIIGCHNSCALTGSGSKNYVGGIVGYSYSYFSSSIVACSNSATIKIVDNNSHVGGIAGIVSFSEIHGCFSVGKIENNGGSIYAGAIAGTNSIGIIEGCYYLANKGASTGVGETPSGTSNTDDVADLTELNYATTGKPIDAMNAAIHSFATNNTDKIDADWLYDSTKQELAFGFLINGTSGDEAEPLISQNVPHPSN